MSKTNRHKFKEDFPAIKKHKFREQYRDSEPAYTIGRSNITEGEIDDEGNEAGFFASNN